MDHRTTTALAVATLVLLAGCGAATTGGQAGATDGPTSTGATTGTADVTGTVELFVSDERNAIDQFAHLNVTITRVGIRRANDAGGSNGSAWIERDVDGVTVDLTELRGANASRLGALAAPNGTYDTVFVYVSAVEGTLDSGEQVNVKLPSRKLQIHDEFTVAPNETVQFVFDISVFEAGKSGKYILKPVVSGSGTGEDVEIREQGEREGNADRDERGNDSLALAVVGNVTPGATVSVTVTREGSPVANATVTANGERVGTTGENGTVALTVPSDAEELELEAEAGDAEGELTVPVADGDAADEDEDGDGDDGDGTATDEGDA